LKYITDGDGNTYPIVHLAGKQWLGKNLNLEVPGSYCYDDDPANCREYGRLYTWEAAKEACRKLGVGWHLPTDQEWKDLLITFGGYYEWYEQEEVGDSEKSYSVLIKDGSSSFAALLGGGRNVDGEYLHLGKYGTYWSASELDASLAWVYGLHGDDERVDRPVSIKSMALSCRCLKNNFSPKDKR
ncbi:MAG: hypothetical protein KDC75_23330, partial [Phaeodactylibacter sp.]|nr:hypothetical protein [Phaeodactylibacter sp.]